MTSIVSFSKLGLFCGIQKCIKALTFKIIHHLHNFQCASLIYFIAASGNILLNQDLKTWKFRLGELRESVTECPLGETEKTRRGLYGRIQVLQSELGSLHFCEDEGLQNSQGHTDI